MQIILLSGGSGSMFWPLSNNARSKQFLRLLPSEADGHSESMIQRVMGQIAASGVKAEVTIATNRLQCDPIVSQLGAGVQIVAEPSRRGTFPAVCLACEYLSLERGVSPDESVVVLPCDQYTDLSYYHALAPMGALAAENAAPLIAMGIPPAFPSVNYGYLLPSPAGNASRSEGETPLVPVASFIEKPSEARAAELISRGALWNAGVYAFRLGWLLVKARHYNAADTYAGILANYASYPETSFDYEVAEKTPGMEMITFTGPWKDLGSWSALLSRQPELQKGNVLMACNQNTHAINELNLPLLCVGTRDLIVAASPDGILVSDKNSSGDIRHLVDRLAARPHYEERRWGEYLVVDHTEFEDGYRTLTKRLTLNPGCSISYQRHAHRDETWTFIDGEGEFILDGERRKIGRGDTVYIASGQLHALRAATPLTFIEVQAGPVLDEDDITRLPNPW